MARPREKCFFEETLPNPLPEAQQWLAEYYENSKKLIDYLHTNGAGNTAHYTTINCLTLLKEHLVLKGEVYTPDRALQWFNELCPCPNGFEVALFRFADVYVFGDVQPLNSFPKVLPYSSCLEEPWSSILDSFLKSSDLSERSLKQVRNCISRFLYRIQQEGVKTPSDITFELIENYCTTDRHRSTNSKARYTYAIGDILLFMADQGLCVHGLGWYPYFWMHNRIYRLCDFSESQIAVVEKYRMESMDFPAEDFAALIADFLERFTACGYSKSPSSTASYVLHNILLFLEMHGLGYHQKIADIWLEHEQTFHKGDSWKKARRILHLFNVYTEEGDVIPRSIFRGKPLLVESLPAWCQNEIGEYLALKKKEGWADSTLDMIRSSLTRFCSFLSVIGFSSFSELSAKTLKDFNLSDKHLTADGKNAYNSRIRKFLMHLERKGAIPNGIHFALCCTAAPKESIVVILTQEEKESIKKKHASSESIMELRDKAMMLLGTKMGLRASDIVTIRLRDIDWDCQTLRVIQEKTNHEILLPMPTEVGNAVYLYLTKARANDRTNSEFLFIKVRAPYDPLGRGVCRAALRRTLPERSVPGSGFHVTRKTYATDRLCAGTGKQGIIDLLGQKDTQSLKHYLVLDEDRMRMCPLSLSETGLLMRGGRYGNV